MKRLLLGVVTLLLTLGCVELALRACGWQATRESVPLELPGQPASAPPFTRHDDLLIYTVVPFARTYPCYAIESHGYRTPPFEDRKAPGPWRLVVTGDSSTFGLNVLGDEHWSSLLRSAIAGLSAGEHATEVIDAGIAGYSTFNQRVQIERDLLPLQPDLVVVLVTGVNDAMRVAGPGDAELSRSQRAWWRVLARTRVAQLFGCGGSGWAPMSPLTAPDSPRGRARVSIDEAEADLRAMADLLPGRLVLGIFPPSAIFPLAQPAAATAACALTVGRDRDVPVADIRPALDALLPVQLYGDPVHPSPAGHAVIARCVLDSLGPMLGLSPARTGWIAARLAAQAGDIEHQTSVLAGNGAPPRFLELLQLFRQAAALDARLADGDPTLPESVLQWDPLLGTRCRALGRARLLLADTEPQRQAEIATFVRPVDPLIACFGNDAAFLAADTDRRALERALLVFDAELGLPAFRADVRLGQAALARNPADAVPLLEAVLALDPDNSAARYDLALRYRSLGRRTDERACFTTLATTQGPHADFARARLAYSAKDDVAEEAALRSAIAAAPALNYAHFMLGELLLRQDRLDEAATELTLAAVLLGSQAEIPALLSRIDKRRQELAASAGH